MHAFDFLILKLSYNIIQVLFVQTPNKVVTKLKQSKVKWKIVIDRSSSAEDFKASHICKAKKIDYHIDVFE